MNAVDAARPRDPRGARGAPLVVAALAVLVGGCALLSLGSGDYSTTCGFSGRTDDACGQCIAAQCQAKVDACCADATCGAEAPSTGAFGVSVTTGESTLSKLDACGRGESCFDLETDPAAAAIAACVESACSDVCDTRRASSRVADATNCQLDSESVSSSGSLPTCTCRVPGSVENAPRSPNGVTCASVPQAVCCADLDWPAPGSSCSCRSARCDVYSNACVCEIGYGASETVSSCQRGVCCVSSYEGSCRCDPTAKSCNGGDLPVDSCTPKQVFCGSGSRRVTSCAAGK